MNNIKIICTIGPASSTPEQIWGLIDAGMNIARLNFSHGSYEGHKAVIQTIKQIRKETGKNIGMLQDLSGPKMRVGKFPDDAILLEKGQEVRLYYGEEYREKSIPEIPVDYPYLMEDTRESGIILLDDGQLELTIIKKETSCLLCQVARGGKLKNRKGVNFPGITLSQTVPTEKDFKDLEFGLSQGVDFVALSFVQRKEDILRLKKRIAELKGSAKVIAKLERDTAIENLDSILEATDGVMVARGDLGIETDIAMIPIYQKEIVRRCNILGKPVITATQMLDSMINNPIPTRAEATDVANAIYDGSDAIMLSGETAAGKYPCQAVKVMRRIANNVEENLGLDRGWVRDDYEIEKAAMNEEISIAHSICKSAKEMKARYIIANTLSGETARRISMYRPETPIIAITPSEETFYQLSIVWGVQTFLSPVLGKDFFEIINNGEKLLKEMGLIKKDDLVVISSGSPDRPGGTNLMKLHRVG